MYTVQLFVAVAMDRTNAARYLPVIQKIQYTLKYTVFKTARSGNKEYDPRESWAVRYKVEVCL